ncbi:MAG: hypothetical protein R2761_18700 [Acidimicrobiales bacterium]
MTEPGFHDEFGFYSPMPLDRAARREPGPDFPTGPAVGSVLPPIVLPDQHGAPVDVAQRRGAAGAVVVFHRSAYW